MPSGIARLLYDVPSVRCAGQENTCACASGTASASAWSIVPDCSSAIRMSPPSTGRLVAVAPQLDA